MKIIMVYKADSIIKCNQIGQIFDEIGNQMKNTPIYNCFLMV